MFHLRISQRILFTALVFVIPAVLQLYFSLESIGDDIEFSEKEQAGDDILHPAVNLLYAVNQHRMLISINGSAATVQKIAEETNHQFDVLASAYQKYAETLQFTEQGLASRGREHLNLAAVHGKWQTLMSKAASMPAEEREKQYISLISDLRGIIAHAGDTSNLILDPDLDSYYTMDVTLLALPQSLDRQGNIGMTFFPKLTRPEGLTQGEKTEAAVQARMLKEADLDRTLASLDIAFKEDPNFYGVSTTLEPEIRKALVFYTKANTALINQMNAMAAGNPVTTGDFLKAAQAAQESSLNLWSTAVKELDILIEKRIDSYRAQRNFVLFWSGLAVAIAMAISSLVSRSIVRPIVTIERTMHALADGKLSIQVPYTDKNDEIGEMARALEHFKYTGQQAEDLIEQQREEQKQKEARQEALEKLVKNFDSKVIQVLNTVSSTTQQLFSSAQSMQGVAESSASRTQNIAAATEQTASNVRAVAAAAEQLTASIQEISTQVHRSANISTNAVNKTQSADETVQHLSEAAQKIGEVISLINDIADQINLLALNATIESARAGEAGKGFAVVASEVKNLAGQTAKATEDIARHIMDIQGVTQNVVTALTEIRGTIDEMNSISTMIASAVEEQGAATQEIARNIQVASTGVQHVCENMTDVTSGASKTSVAASEVLTSAKIFSEESGKLKSEVEEFLTSVRHG